MKKNYMLKVNFYNNLNNLLIFYLKRLEKIQFYLNGHIS